MAFDLLIRGGTLVTGDAMDVADVAVRNGTIEAIGTFSAAQAADVVDAKGLLVLPGVIDSQVHFREPGLDHKEDLATGTRAALLGGVTTVFEEPNTNPTTTTPEALADKLRRAKDRAWCHYAFWVGASTENLDDLMALEQLPGSPGIGEVFMGSSTGPLLVANDDDLRTVLRNGRRRVAIHAEDEARNVARKQAYLEGRLEPDPSLGYDLRQNAADHPHLRDAESARLATERILRMSEETGRPVHILHMSTADEMPLIREAKHRGLGTTAEITPQHLWFAAPECYERLASLAQMNPPIRSDHHRQALRAAFREGLFDVIGSDHAPHTLAEKALPYPNSPSGLTGVQTLVPVFFTLMREGLLDPQKFVRMASENPARLFQVVGKGFIEPGYDADLILLDPNNPFTVENDWIASKCGWSPYAGETLFGRPLHVFINGAWAVRDGEIQGTPQGRMVEFARKGTR